jgi:hypothetical protein
VIIDDMSVRAPQRCDIFPQKEFKRQCEGMGRARPVALELWARAGPRATGSGERDGKRREARTQLVLQKHKIGLGSAAPSTSLPACETANASPCLNHKELHCLRVFSDLVPLDLIRNPRHAVVRAIAI